MEYVKELNSQMLTLNAENEQWTLTLVLISRVEGNVSRLLVYSQQFKAPWAGYITHLASIGSRGGHLLASNINIEKYDAQIQHERVNQSYNT